jgi:cell division transport system permease protein
MSKKKNSAGSIKLKRIFRSGFVSFWRNSFVSFSAILMMVFTLFIIGTAVFTGVILQTTLAEFRSQADMNIYFTTDAPEERIVEMQSSLETLPEVKSVEYLPREQALAQFRERHQNDQLTLQALDELGENPFGAVLNVEANDITQYGAIAAFIEDQQAAAGGTSVIDTVNYFDEQHRAAIDRLAAITDSSKIIGFFLILILVATTIAISLNTVRLAIYSSREEISVMRLVGADQFYIRAPFMVEGVLYGLVAGLVTLILFYPLTWWLGSATAGFFGGVNVFHYYLSNFPLFFLLIVGVGMSLGAVSAFLAVRRYLTI